MRSICNPVLITFATHPAKAANLIRSSADSGWPLIVIEEPWQGFDYKFLRILQEVNRLYREGYTHMISVDAYDTVVVRPKSEFTIYNHQLILAAETNCYPDWLLRHRYPPFTSPWKYVNSPYILDLRRGIPPGFEAIKCNDDQLHLSHYYLDNYKTQPFMLDTNCRFFQTLYGVPRKYFQLVTGKWLNTLTNTFPFFFHGNGSVDMEWITWPNQECSLEFQLENSQDVQTSTTILTT